MEATKWADEELRSQPTPATTQDALGPFGASSGSAEQGAPECKTAATRQAPAAAPGAARPAEQVPAAATSQVPAAAPAAAPPAKPRTEESSLLPEPTVSFSSATETDGYLYRVLRKGEETPLKLRKPPSVGHLKSEELRVLLLRSIAGVLLWSKEDKPTCFLHCTTTARDACKISSDRQIRIFYTNWLVRWPRAAISHLIDFTKGAEKELWLKKESTDSKYIAVCLEKALRCCKHEPTVVCMVSPPPDKVEWWDPERLQWASLSTAISQSAPAAPNPGGAGAGASKVARAGAKQALSHHIWTHTHVQNVRHTSPHAHVHTHTRTYIHTHMHT